jgi:glycogen operon protein
MRRYWRGEGNLLGDIASALTASAPLYRHDSRAPQASINHVTVHDGFTLADLVSYEHKHNEANGEDNPTAPTTTSASIAASKARATTPRFWRAAGSPAAISSHRC